VAGFALGVGYCRPGLPLRRVLPRIAFFASMSALGNLAGTFTQLAISARGSILFEAVFDSLGARTFFYSAALESCITPALWDVAIIQSGFPRTTAYLKF
jgi:hypothetical protein